MKAKDAIPPEDEFELETETAEEATAEAAASPTARSLPPATLSDEEQAEWWMENVYGGDDTPQLTVRALVTSIGIGALMAISNVYVGLKTGWGLGVTVTAAVLGFVLFRSLGVLFPSVRRNPLTMLENCASMSSASAAAAISSAGLVSAIPALYLCTGKPMAAWQMMAWLICVAALGLFMAIPLKRQMINVDKLAFPTGTATGETLRSLHSTGAKAMQQAKTLIYCGLIGAAVKFWGGGLKDLLKWVWVQHQWPWLKGAAKFTPPDCLPLLPGKAAASWLDRYAIGFEPNTLFIAFGALMGIRVGTSMLIGMVVFFGMLGPWMDYLGVLNYSTGKSPYAVVVAWALWPAVALMVTAGLTNFGLRWRMIARAMGEMKSVFGSRGKQSRAEEVEAPMWWFVAGTIAMGTACVLLGIQFFGIAWWMGALAVVLTFFLSIVAARATGETDTTPIGAMGKITQLTYGVIDPGNLKTNLMTAGITAGAACHAADLLQSLKAGYLVGASPRKQTLAQFFGLFVGMLVSVPIYCVLVRAPEFDPGAPKPAVAKHAAAEPEGIDAEFDAALAAAQKPDKAEKNPGETNLLTSEFPAPSVVVWKGVAELLKDGLDKLPPYSGKGMVIGGILGIIIALLEEFLPKRYAKWVPSATGLGLAGVIPPQNSISMFLGSLIAWVWMKRHPKSCDDYMVSGSSGLIAGESLTGVGVNLFAAAKFFFFG